MCHIIAYCDCNRIPHITFEKRLVTISNEIPGCLEIMFQWRYGAGCLASVVSVSESVASVTSVAGIRRWVVAAAVVAAAVELLGRLQVRLRGLTERWGCQGEGHQDDSEQSNVFLHVDC